jgi:hypothetical protein
MRSTLALLVLLFVAISASAQPQQTDSGLMSDADFRAFLAHLDAAIPKWEAEFNSIDVEKNAQISYVAGKAIMDRRGLCLMEIGSIRTYVAKLHGRRTVSGELALSGFLQSLFDLAEEESSMEDIAGVVLSHFDKYAQELGSLEARASSDVFAPVELLEKETCP